MNVVKFFKRQIFVIFCFFASTSLASADLAPQDPDNALSDPVLWLEHSKSEIAFELAPKWMVHSCNYTSFHHMWVFAQTLRPEGMYVLVYGSIWVSEDVDGGQPPLVDLQNDGNGEVDLIHKDRSCKYMWNPDNAFDGIFPSQPGNLPTPAQAAIIHDLAVDLIRREEKIFGGRDGFFQALAATGHGIGDQYSVMIPLLKSLKSEK